MTNQDWMVRNEALKTEINHLRRQVKKVSAEKDQVVIEWNQLATELGMASVT